MEQDQTTTMYSLISLYTETTRIESYYASLAKCVPCKAHRAFPVDVLEITDQDQTSLLCSLILLMVIVYVRVLHFVSFSLTSFTKITMDLVQGAGQDQTTNVQGVP